MNNASFRIYWLTVFVLFLLCLQASAESLPQLNKDNVKEVIAAMTLEEKVGLVTGAPRPRMFPGAEQQGPSVGLTQNLVPGAAGTTLAIERLGIPAMVLADGPAGLRIQPRREDQPDRTYYCTAFPIATLLASSWDVDLVESVGRSMGNEVKEYGVDILLAPALNIHRYPLGARNFEYYSEDPLVAGKMAAAMVRGVQSQGVGTSIKHYVANNHEWNRGVINVKVDERALREIYLRGFEIAIKEGEPWTVMSSYNKVNGSYTSESPKLLRQVLRDQWGFKGLVMTDWGGGRDAIGQMAAGNDLLMPGRDQQRETLLAALKSEELDESIVDHNLENILNIVVQSPRYNKFKYSDKPDLKANAEVARAAATEGMVLLKNADSALPLPANATLALFGNTSYEMITGGTGSGDVNEAYSISMEQGLVDAGLKPDTKLSKNYQDYIAAERAKQPPREGRMMFRPPQPIAERDPGMEEIKQMAESTDLALITIGRNAGEGRDRVAENDFYLSEAEQKLIAAVSTEFRSKKKPVIVILNIGGVIETASWRDRADAILLAWQPGQEAGHAVADVLTGKANPSGKLATTFSVKLEDFPPAANFPGVVTEEGDPNAESYFARGARAAEVEYKDSIWVGYRYFNTRKVATAYPFGHGLSYTSFKYNDLKLSSKTFNNTITVSIKVTNSGKLAGREVVQLYISAPEGKIEKPAGELRAFAKTRLLQPGESQTLTFKLNARDLSSYDTDSATWLAEAGKYTVKIGASSKDIRQSATFKKAKASSLPL